MDKNNLTGFLLLMGLMVGWFYYTSPSTEELEEVQRIEDSIRVAQQAVSETVLENNNQTIETTNQALDSNRLAKLDEEYGVFAPAVVGKETIVSLENEFLKIDFSTKGANIKNVWVKKHKTITEDKEGNEIENPLVLLNNDKNKFEYIFAVPQVAAGEISTSELIFTPQINENHVDFVAQLDNGRNITLSYSLGDNYEVKHSIQQKGLENYFQKSKETVQLRWVNHIEKLERNTEFEKMYSTVYFKPAEDDVDYCSCRSDDNEVMKEPVSWVSTTNQFFNTTLFAKSKPFYSADLTTEVLGENNSALKKITSLIEIPKSELSTGMQMNFYIGPNDYDVLAAYNDDVQYIIPYGWSFFGTINRYVIRPLFGFLLGFVGIEGIAIILMTLIVKLVVFPLTYKALYAQSKMAALKPRIEKLKSKHPDDPQKAQMENMKLYQEYGVNPAGGCLPMVLQMPIWYALFRFFPATIDFRQASFLWATDLSSYDVFARLPFEVPFYGSHISLFTILWAITTVIYTYYNSKHMDMSANPAMKYVQYGMPVMFLFFFNNYSAGLTCYMFFSNFLNIGQNIITKNFLIDKNKIEEELKANKAKPKKKSGFQQRLQNIMEEQQKQQAMQNKKKK